MTKPRAKPATQERMRDEVYGMPLEQVIEAAKPAPAKTPKAPQIDGAAEKALWPSLEELKHGPKGPRRRRA